MGRPRKTASVPDPLLDLSKKTEILEREMEAQRAAIERLKQIGALRPQPLSVSIDRRHQAKRRASR